MLWSTLLDLVHYWILILVCVMSCFDSAAVLLGDSRVM